MNTYQNAALGLLFILLSCHPQQETIQVSKAGAPKSSLTNSAEEGITFIYHYSPQRAKLEWTAVKVNRPSGDQLKDALSALLRDFSDSSICTGLKLNQLTKEADQRVIYLSGEAVLKTPQDSTIFWSALDLTINRYTKSGGYRIIINE